MRLRQLFVREPLQIREEFDVGGMFRCVADGRGGVRILADGAEDFASACAQLLGQPGLRRRLVDEAEREFKARFQWSSVRQQIRALALDVSAVTPS